MNPNLGKLITYELMVLLKPLPKNELKPILKRTADAIFQKGGIIRKIQNLGTNEIPYKISLEGTRYKQASYFLYEFHVPPATVKDLSEELSRDVDIVRPSIVRKNEESLDFECTLDEELKPPPYRKDVQELMQLAKKKEKPKFEYNAEWDHYPFQK